MDTAGVTVDPILATAFAAIGVLWVAYSIVQEARHRAKDKRIEALEKANGILEQEAKEYLALIVAGDPADPGEARRIAANILRGRKGYGS
jgi:pyrroloquinoline quinone (PQQ) biosynthesis protein C